MSIERNDWRNAANAVDTLWGKFEVIGSIRKKYQEETDCNSEIFTDKVTLRKDTPFKQGYAFLLHRGLNVPLQNIADSIPSYSEEHSNVVKASRSFRDQMEILGIPRKASPELSYGLGLGVNTINKINWENIDTQDYLNRFAEEVGVPLEDFYSNRRPQVLADLKLAFLYFVIEKVKLGSSTEIFDYFGFTHDPSGYRHRKLNFGSMLESAITAKAPVKKTMEDIQRPANHPEIGAPHLFTKRFICV